MDPVIEVAHGVGRVYESPIPVSWYLAGAGLTVLASFFIRAFARRERPLPYREVGGTRAAAIIAGFSRVYLLVVFGLVVVFSVVYADSGGFGIPALAFWVCLVILPIVLFSIVGGLWPETSPWTTIEGFYRLEDEVESPTRKVPWWLPPALIYAFFWFELVSGRGFEPLSILVVVVAYTVYYLSSHRAYGRDFSDAEPLGILFGFAQRIAPFRVKDGTVVYRGFVGGLDEADPMPKGLFAAVFVLLASTTLDNVRETVEWSNFLRATGLGGLDEKLVDSIALLAFALPFLLPFLGCAALARRWARDPVGLWDTARRFGWSLIPIGIAYVLAHNMPLLIIGVPSLAEQLAEGLGSDALGSYVASPQLVWILEIGLIVGGHVLGVLAAHRAGVRITGSHEGALKSHVALTLLMSFYTVSTLLLLSLPLVTSK